MNIHWRPYQIACKKAIKENYDKGITKQLIVQATGCHAKGTEILMYDGRIKTVETIKTGDLLMGDDSTPRKVLNLINGKEQMCEIIPKKGDSFIVNESHILSLKRTPTPGRYPGMPEIINISVKEYLTKNKHFKHLYKLYRTGIDFEKKFNDIYSDIVSPYILGLWLGDGSSIRPLIVSNEPEIDNYLYETKLVTNRYHKGNELYSYYLGINNKKFDSNPVWNILKKFTRLSEKYVEDGLLALEYQDRLQILAGLLDSDGSLDCNGYDFINKNKTITDAVLFLARSLGLAAYCKEVKKRCVNTNKWGDYYRIYISGNVDIIPCKVSHKIAKKRKQKKDVLVTGFKIKKTKKDWYYGFELDGNHLYCMGDFTVTHNTGKRLQAVNLAKHFNRTLFIAHREELIQQAYNEIEQYWPMQTGIIKGPLFELEKKIVVASVQTLHNRLNKIDPRMFDLLIIDEMHHYVSRTYLKSVRYFEPKLLTGWTATPKRLDGLSLSNIVQDLVFEYNIENGINDEFLASIEAYQIKTAADISMVKRTAGDFNIKQLSEKIDSELRNNLIVHKYKEYTLGIQALAYCVDIDHAYNLRDKFRSNDILCEAVVSDTQRCPNRADIINRFKKGEIDVLTNVNILTEGFDYEDIGCILMGRPTQSETLYIQSIGRGTRLKSELFQKRHKVDKCIILDFVDNTGNMSLVNAWELEKGKPIEDRVFVPAKNKALLIEEREKRDRKLRVLYGTDKKIDLLELPTVRPWNSEKMLDPATEKQIKWIKDMGVFQEGIEYTKAMASELIGGQPAAEWQIRWLGQQKYDVSGKVSMGQYQKAKWLQNNRQKYAMNSKT